MWGISPPYRLMIATSSSGTLDDPCITSGVVGQRPLTFPYNSDPQRRHDPRELLEQVRTQLIETARPVLESMVLEVAGVKVVSRHHDISTLTGEELVLFTLATSPMFREKKSK